MTPADVIVWPKELLVPSVQGNAWNMRMQTISPGQTAAGSMPLINMDGGGLWSAVTPEAMIKTIQEVKFLRAIRTACQGGLVPLLVPRFDLGIRPFPLDGSGVPITGYGPLPWQDDVLWQDDTSWYQPVIDTIVVGGGSMGTNQLHLRINYGSPLDGGESFSLRHIVQGEHLYEISFVDDITYGPLEPIITFGPPLRDDIANAAPCNFDWPSCVVYLENPKALDFTFTILPFPRPALSFLEFIF